jgi:hypothetical protein
MTIPSVPVYDQQGYNITLGELRKSYEHLGSSKALAEPMYFLAHLTTLENFRAHNLRQNSTVN